MSSSYRPPDPKKQLSVRIRTSIHKKLERIRDYWREEALSSALAEGIPEGSSRAQIEKAVELEIDMTYTVERLLDDKTDVELGEFGGLAKSAEAKAIVAKGLAAADVPSKKKH